MKVAGGLEMKRVLVTGGAGGIGLAIARRFHAEGCHVLIGDVSEAALAAAQDALLGLVALRCDFSVLADIEALFEVLGRELGGLDVLVNNVGIGGPTTPAEHLSSDEWQHVLDVNLTGTFEVTKRAIPLLKESAGTIINLSSAAGRFGYPNRLAYSVTKWGIVGLTKTLSMELGRDGISVNAILPGAVGGDRFERVMEGRSQLSGKSRDELVDELLKIQSLKKIVQPEHVADLAYFLTTESGRYISGQTLPVDCDMQRA
jgi:NAD(P)-dependent dehydrogenase (short-subunit alcohol dehydrogenase family)